MTFAIDSCFQAISVIVLGFATAALALREAPLKDVPNGRSLALLFSGCLFALPGVVVFSILLRERLVTQMGLITLFMACALKKADRD